MNRKKLEKYAMKLKNILMVCVISFTLCFTLGCENNANVPEESHEQTPPTSEQDAPNEQPEIKPDDVISTPNDKVSQVFVQKDTDGTDDGVSKLISMMSDNGEYLYKTNDNPDGMIASDDVVMLFFNVQWSGRGGTNTDLISSVIDALMNHPDGFNGEIIVADSGQGDGTLDHAQPNSANKDQSTLDVINAQKAKGVRVTGYLLDDIMNDKVDEYIDGDDADGYVLEDGISESTKLAFSYPKFTTDYGTRVSIKMGLWDGSTYDSERLKIINMPVLKSHGTYKATGAVKNYMGMPSQPISNAAGGSPHNSVALGGMGEMLVKSRMPVLNIVDMIYVGTHSGPWVTYNQATECRMIAASIDPFAVDYWAVTNVLIPEADAVGNTNVPAMDPDSDVPGTFGYWMKLSLEEVIKAGYTEFTMNPDSIVVHEQ